MGKAANLGHRGEVSWEKAAEREQLGKGIWKRPARREASGRENLGNASLQRPARKRLHTEKGESRADLGQGS